jgi:hypothetical protein
MLFELSIVKPRSNQRFEEQSVDEKVLVLVPKLEPAFT